MRYNSIHSKFLTARSAIHIYRSLLRNANISQSQPNTKEINKHVPHRSQFVGLSHVDRTRSFDGAVETSWSEAMRSEQRVQRLVARHSKLQRKHANHSYMCELSISLQGLGNKTQIQTFHVQTMHDFHSYRQHTLIICSLTSKGYRQRQHR